MAILTGGCQCGAVRFRAEALVDNAHVCHCRMCQKAVGNFFAALVGVPKVDLTWVRGEPSAFESSENVERGFCSNCGTPLFYHHRDSAHISFCIAVFDDPAAIPIKAEFGIESRLPQIAQLGHLPAERTDAELEEECTSTSRQHPDHETWDDPEDFPV